MMATTTTTSTSAPLSALGSVAIPLADLQWTHAIDFSQYSLWFCVASIAFAPFFWNVVVRTEYKTKWMSRLFRGAYPACYTLAAIIFLLSLERDWAFTNALLDQPTVILPEEWSWYSNIAAYVLSISGTILVLSSFYRLGITGTYLGDYFGILMDEMVTGFPFNILANPMYVGTSMNFLAGALWFSSPAGLLITLWVYSVYMIAITLEEPWTHWIYAQRDKKVTVTKPTNRKAKKVA